MQNSEWTREEPGWYCCDEVGGICKERDGKWYYYPLSRFSSPVIGKFDTLKEAKKFAERVVFHAP